MLALYISMALLVVGMTSEVFVPLFLQVLHQQTPLLAGYIAALMAAGWTLGAIFSSGLDPRGAARAIAIGPFLVVAGLLLACLFMPATATPALSLGAVCLAMLLVASVSAWPGRTCCPGFWNRPRRIRRNWPAPRLPRCNWWPLPWGRRWRE